MRFRKFCMLLIMVITTQHQMASGEVIPGRFWYSTRIPTVSLDTPLVTFTWDKFKCASAANLRPDCYLFCHSEGQCSLRPLQMVAFAEPAEVYGETVTCWTRLKEWPPCPDSFRRLPGLEDLGCFLEDNSSKKWSDARTSCQSRGADLAVMRTTQDFLRLRDHYASQSELSGLWVGAYDGTWLNGRIPDTQEWADGEPNGSGACVDIRLMTPTGLVYNFLLSDNICASVHGFLCQI